MADELGLRATLARDERHRAWQGALAWLAQPVRTPPAPSRRRPRQPTLVPDALAGFGVGCAVLGPARAACVRAQTASPEGEAGVPAVRRRASSSSVHVRVGGAVACVSQRFWRSAGVGIVGPTPSRRGQDRRSSTPGRKVVAAHAGTARGTPHRAPAGASGGSRPAAPRIESERSLSSRTRGTPCTLVGQMGDLFHPTRDELDLTAVMHALSDPARRKVVPALAVEGERASGTFELGVTKATRIASLQGPARGRRHADAHRRRPPLPHPAPRRPRRALPRPARRRPGGRAGARRRLTRQRSHSGRAGRGERPAGSAAPPEHAHPLRCPRAAGAPGSARPPAGARASRRAAVRRALKHPRADALPPADRRRSCWSTSALLCASPRARRLADRRRQRAVGARRA